MTPPDIETDVSNGRIADPPESFRHLFPETIFNKFEIFSYRNAASVLASSFPEQFTTLITVLEAFQISTTQIRTPGGSKGPIAR